MTKEKKPRSNPQKVKEPLAPCQRTRYENAIESLQNDVANLQIENAQLQHQIIGYKAVISYLEAQAGLKETQQ
jgi:predicted RNase H-like nuclease (RuvC/YqgF family)